MGNTPHPQITDYHAKYFAYELTRRLPADSIGKLTATLQDAQVDLNPHQIEAALFAFKSPLSKGAILADEVGLGKTIEAGIILSQKWAELKRKLLIITPSNLRKQWNQELLDKFFLPSMIIESSTFNAESEGGSVNPFERNEIVICSYQFARQKEMWINSVNWDLVVIDEAHRLRNVYKPQNKIANSIKKSLAHTKKVLLTATPLQNSLMELFGLVSFVDEYSFGDLKSFKSKYSRLTSPSDFHELKSRLSPVCKRTLRRQVKEYINYTNRIAIVEEYIPSDDEVELYELVSEYLRQPKLYALPSSQRSLMTLILRRLLASSTFAVQGTLEALAKRLDETLVRGVQHSVEFQTIQYENINEVIDEWGDEDNESESPVSVKLELSEEQKVEIAQERDRLKQYSKLAKRIIKNAKGEKLLTALEKGFEKLAELGAPGKAIIFTESTRTQEYIRSILETNGYNGKIVLFNGTNNDRESKRLYREWLQEHKGTDRVSGSKTADIRQAIVDHFRDTATIMIATEAAAEGINLQFCSLVVNYDLPWNPQRIEQRIGRCHRYGQKHDVVVINFLNKLNAADQHVYRLLDEKFKLFNGVFGASDEVLGSIESGIDFEKRIIKIYQECRKTEEIQEAFKQLRVELEPEIEANLDSTRRALLENFDEDVANKLRVNLEQGREYLNRFERMLWSVTRHTLKDLAEFNLTDHTFVIKENPFPDITINTGKYRFLTTSSSGKKSESTWDPDTNLYRIGHPLAHRITAECRSKHPGVYEVVFDYSNSPVKISVLEPLLGKSGWLNATLVSIESFETEDHIVFDCFDEDYQPIESQIAEKLFLLDGVKGNPVYYPTELSLQSAALKKIFIQDILDENIRRNGRYFDDECEKMDKWADDLKISLEKEIKDLDAEIKLRKSEVRKMINLKDKVDGQRSIKELEKKRNEKRRSLYAAQDQIDTQKDDLISEIEARMRHSISEEPLFSIKWILI